MTRPAAAALSHCARTSGPKRQRSDDFAARPRSAPNNSSADRSGFEKPRRSDSRTLPSMTTMTCRQLGGPCDVEHHGNDHNEVIKAQDRHLKAQVAAGDETHREAHEA